ncbi:MAG: hypothetical protein WKG00_09180 [Polyangiaceae bacterium]
MKTRNAIARPLAVIALVGAGGLFAGCFGGEAESEAPLIDDPELEAQAPSCNPACGPGKTCGGTNCCVANDAPWNQCGLQDGADATVIVDDDPVYYVSASSYGDVECPSKFVVDVVPGESNWETISVSKTLLGVSQCACRSYDAYLKLRGTYRHHVCLANGCSPCGNGCGQYYPLYDLDAEEEVTAQATWNAALGQCRVTALLYRLSQGGTAGPADRWDGEVEVHAEIRQRGVALHKPVTVRVLNED